MSTIKNYEKNTRNLKIETRPLMADMLMQLTESFEK